MNVFHWFKTRRPPRLALVTWSHNCAGFLAANLRYHAPLGVERAYVFLDRCSDDSERVARSFSWVRTFVIDSDDRSRFDHVIDMQAICMNQALSLARDEGFDWLLTLDADEFAYGAEHCDTSNAVVDGQLRRLLERAPSTAEVVRLPAKEVVPLDLGEDVPFWQQRYFQHQTILPRDFADPFTGEVRRCQRVLSHQDGKSIVRTRVDAQAYDPHQWVYNQERHFPDRPEYVPLRHWWGGSLYHFHVTSARHWREKYAAFSTEPNTWPNGNAQEFPRPQWKLACTRLPEAELTNYFRRWVAMPEAELREHARQGRVSEERTVEHVLRAAGKEHVAGASSAQRFRLLPRKRESIDGSDMAKMDPARLIGFYGLERSKRGLFRWSRPQASVRLDTPPGNYDLTIDMKDLAHLCNSTLRVQLNERPLSDTRRRGGTIHIRLDADDFDAASEHWLRLSFDPLVPTARRRHDDRELGAPIFAIVIARGDRQGAWRRGRHEGIRG